MDRYKKFREVVKVIYLKASTIFYAVLDNKIPLACNDRRWRIFAIEALAEVSKGLTYIFLIWQRPQTIDVYGPMIFA